MLTSLLLIVLAFGVTLLLKKQNRAHTQECKAADILSMNEQYHKCVPQVLMLLNMLIFLNVYACKMD